MSKRNMQSVCKAAISAAEFPLNLSLLSLRCARLSLFWNNIKKMMSANLKEMLRVIIWP